MSRRRYDKGDVKWLAPTAKSYKARTLAWSTKAASDLIVALSQEYDTIQEVHDTILPMTLRLGQCCRPISIRAMETT